VPQNAESPATERDVVGEKRLWNPQAVTVEAVAQIPKWVFVTSAGGGRPFSVPYALWRSLPFAAPDSPE